MSSQSRHCRPETGTKRLLSETMSVISFELTASVRDIPYPLSINGDFADADWPPEAFSVAILPRTAAIMNDMVRMGCVRAVAALVADGVEVPALTCDLICHVSDMISQGYTKWMLATLRLYCEKIIDGIFPYPCTHEQCRCRYIMWHYYEVNPLVREFFDEEMNVTVFPTKCEDMFTFIEHARIILLLSIIVDEKHIHDHVRYWINTDIALKNKFLLKLLGALNCDRHLCDNIMKLLHRFPSDFMKYACPLEPENDVNHVECVCNWNYLLHGAAMGRNKPFFMWLLSRGIDVREEKPDVFDLALRFMYDHFDDSYIRALMQRGCYLPSRLMQLGCISKIGFHNLDLFGRSLAVHMRHCNAEIVDLADKLCFHNSFNYGEKRAHRKDVALRIPGGIMIMRDMFNRMMSKNYVTNDICVAELAYYQRAILEPLMWLQACQKRTQPGNKRFPREILRKIAQFLLYF